MKDERMTKQELVAELKSLRQQVQRLEGQACRTEEDRRELSDSRRIVDALVRLQGELLGSQDTKTLFERILDELLRLSESKYGFIGEVLHGHKSEPYLRVRALSDLSWDAESRTMYERHAGTGFEFKELSSLIGVILKSGKPLISNNPSRDRRSSGRMPKGHPTLKNFLGVPFHAAGEFLGIVGLAERPSGFDRKMVTKLKPLLSVCSSVTELSRTGGAKQPVLDTKHADAMSLSDVFYEIAEPVLVVDREYRIRHINKAAREFYGLSDDPACTAGYCYQVSHGISEPCGVGGGFACPKDEVFRTGQPTGVIHVHRDRDGTERHVSILATPLKDVQGEVVGMIETFRDITEYREMEQAMAESEEMFRASFEHAAIGMAIVDPQGQGVESNPALQHMLGYTASEIAGMNYLKVVPPEDREKDMAIFYEALHGKRSHYLAERRLLRKDGSAIWGRVSATMIHGLDGIPRFVIFLVENITAQKKATEELAYSERFLQSIIDAEPECVKLLDEKCAIVRMNPSGVAMVDAANEGQLVGQDASMIVDEEFRDDFRAFTQAVCKGEKGSLTFRITSLKGVKRWLESYAVPFHDPAADRTLLLGVTRDVTERRRMEEDLRRAEAQWRNTFDSISDIVSVHDREFRIVKANKTMFAFFGKKPEDVLGTYCYELFHGCSRPLGTCPHKRMLEEKRAMTEEIYDERLGVSLLVTASPIFDEQGEIVGSIHICKDISALKAIEADLRNSLAEKELLIKEVHHRVKNNLNIISSLLRLQSRDVEDPHTRGLFTESQNRVNTMSMIHEKLYRTDSLKSIECSEYIRELVVHVFRSFNTHPGVNLRMDVDQISLDMDTIIPCALIINELVSNALKYAFPGEQGGEILVSFKPEGEDRGPDEPRRFSLIVRDNGIGLPDEVDSKYHSLGMRIVTSLAAQLDGEVEINRLSPGTEFRVSLTENRFNE